jgi:hypothetical protein
MVSFDPLEAGHGTDRHGQECSMNYWEGPSRWINTVLLIIVGFIAFDTLFLLLSANESNLIVGFVSALAGVFLAPFRGMFTDQPELLTAVVAVLGYCLLAGIALAITRSIATSRAERAAAEEERQARLAQRSRREAAYGDYDDAYDDRYDRYGRYEDRYGDGDRTQRL